MNAEQFTMWLHGFFEISESEELSKKQVQIIKDHLDLLFCKETPDRSEILIETIEKMRETPMINSSEPGAYNWLKYPYEAGPRQVLC